MSLDYEKEKGEMERYKQAKRFENIVRLAVLFLVVLVCVATFSFIKLGNARRENERYDNLIAQLIQEKGQVSLTVDEKTSPDYLEQQVRDKLGMIKENETHIEFQK